MPTPRLAVDNLVFTMPRRYIDCFSAHRKHILISFYTNSIFHNRRMHSPFLPVSISLILLSTLVHVTHFLFSTFSALNSLYIYKNSVVLFRLQLFKLEISLIYECKHSLYLFIIIIIVRIQKIRTFHLISLSMPLASIQRSVAVIDTRRATVMKSIQ